MPTTREFADGPGEPGLVSVIIPTFNRAYLVGSAIESVLAQTYRPVEMIVVDDGSSDGTREVVGRFGSAVRYFGQANAGVSAARNRGLREARGEFIALLDSDDRWMPWKLEAQVHLLRRLPQVGMVWTDMTAVTERGDVVSPTYLRTFYAAYRRVQVEHMFEQGGPLGDLWPAAPPELQSRRYFAGDVFSWMLLGSLVHTPTVMLRRERLQRVGAFDESRRFAGEDYDYHLRTCRAGLVAFLDAPSMWYRVGAADQITAPDRALYFAQSNLQNVLHYLEHDRTRVRLSARQIRGRLAESYAWLGREELRAGDIAAARAHLARSFCLQPIHARNSLLLLLSLLPGFAYRAVQLTRHMLGQTH